MAIQITHGNILNAMQECIVIPVNCVGVMGAGLAKQAKLKWPDMYNHYYRACGYSQMRIGHIWTYKNDNNIIICFPTKDDWRNPSQMSFIVSGLVSLNTFITVYRPNSIALPKLGCGHGGLLWKDVLPQIEYYLESAAKVCDIYLYV